MTFTAASAATLSRCTLLVVDEKPLFRDMVRAAFLTKVKGVREAACIDKALETLHHARGDIGCVICDWDMMPIGGLELLRMIRAGTVSGVSPRTPVVILTARADPEAVKVAMELDVNGFVVSPVSLDKLIGTVGEALSRTWILQQPGHYALVRGIVPPPPILDKVGLDKVTMEKVTIDKIALAKAKSPKSDGKGIVLRRTGNPAPALGARPFTRREPLSQGERPLRNVRMCILDDVSPGAVLARDLRDRDGRVLAPRGTELKPAVLERLRNVGYALSDSYCVWVGDR